MRKYQIYSGAKPSSVNKTFAVNWGSKYFTVSPIAGKEGIRGLVCDSSAANGNQLTCTFTNPNKDSVKATPVHWTCVNPDYDSGKTQTIAFPNSSPMTLGPNSAFSYQWDASEAVHAGKNTCQALFAVGAAFPYQQGSPTTFSETIDVYDKFSAPTVTGAKVLGTNADGQVESHTLGIADISSLQSTLDGKMAKSDLSYNASTGVLTIS